MGGSETPQDVLNTCSRSDCMAPKLVAVTLTLTIAPGKLKKGVIHTRKGKLASNCLALLTKTVEGDTP